MLQELQRRNYSPSTIRSSLGAVQQFAEHFHCSPERLDSEHLRRYQVFLLQDKKLEPSTVEIRISALRFLYKRTLRRRDLAYDDLIFPKVPQKLPIVPSQEEVVRLIDAAPNCLYRMILVLLDATGVRRTEAARIKVEDIDSKRMVIHIRQGKGARDRDVPLSPKLLGESVVWHPIFGWSSWTSAETSGDSAAKEIGRQKCARLFSGVPGHSHKVPHVPERNVTTKYYD